MTTNNLVGLLSQSWNAQLLHTRLCCFLASIQISQETGKMVRNSHFFKSFPQLVVIHTVKGFSVVNETEVDVFLEFLCFLYDPGNIGSLISGSSAFSKPSLKTLKFLVHVMMKPSFQDFEHNLTSMGDECSCLAWTLFNTALLGNWDGDWAVPVLSPWLGFPDLLTYWVHNFNSIIF